MTQRHDADASEARARRVAELRAAVESGSYRPEPGVVAESVIAWLAPPQLFDGDLRRGDGSAEE